MKKTFALTKKRILELFEKLNKEFSKQNTQAEIHLVGGAVMCLVFNARKSTLDLDGYFLPTKKVREATEKISKEEGLPKDWLNDGVKGFFSEHGDFSLFFERSHLKIFTATPEYLLAMKCLSTRIAPEFSDIADIQYLLRYLNIETIKDAVEVITKYYPKDKFPPKTMYVLEEILKK